MVKVIGICSGDETGILTNLTVDNDSTSTPAFTLTMRICRLNLATVQSPPSDRRDQRNGQCHAAQGNSAFLIVKMNAFEGIVVRVMLVRKCRRYGICEVGLQLEDKMSEGSGKFRRHTSHV